MLVPEEPAARPLTSEAEASSMISKLDKPKSASRISGGSSGVVAKLHWLIPKVQIAKAMTLVQAGAVRRFGMELADLAGLVD